MPEANSFLREWPTVPQHSGGLWRFRIVWRFRTGCPWRDLPADFGSWKTVWKRHHRFSFDGTYQRIIDVVCAQWRDDELDEGIARLLSVDSTVVRAHQHAAGAPSAGDTGC